jgi:hypothetical protein
MKRAISIFLVFPLVLLAFTGCENSEQQAIDATSTNAISNEAELENSVSSPENDNSAITKLVIPADLEKYRSQIEESYSKAQQNYKEKYEDGIGFKIGTDVYILDGSNLAGVDKRICVELSFESFTNQIDMNLGYILKNGEYMYDGDWFDLQSSDAGFEWLISL